MDHNFNSFQTSNFDGTPMNGGFDIKGNPMGFIENNIPKYQDYGKASNSVQATNVDGTPMNGEVDIKGNPKGIIKYSRLSGRAKLSIFLFIFNSIILLSGVF